MNKCLTVIHKEEFESAIYFAEIKTEDEFKTIRCGERYFYIAIKKPHYRNYFRVAHFKHDKDSIVHYAKCVCDIK